MIRTSSGYNNSSTDSVRTPPYITDAIKAEFNVDSLWDPCPLDPLWDREKCFNGLSVPWEGDVIFINPPYSSPKKWLIRAREEWLKGKTIILLVKAEIVGSQYFKHAEGAEIRFINHHVRYPNYRKRAPFSNMLIIFHADKKCTDWKLVDMRSNVDQEQHSHSSSYIV